MTASFKHLGIVIIVNNFTAATIQNPHILTMLASKNGI